MATTNPKKKISWLPLLCEMMQLDGRDEHKDMNSTYALWVLDDGSNVVFLHKDLLNNIIYSDRRFIDWLMIKPPDECCRMISRTLLASLRYKPDYIVLVGDDETGAPYASGYSMSSVLKLADGCPTLTNIRMLAENGRHNHPMGIPTSPFCLQDTGNNILGRRLAGRCCTLADRGFFSDERNRVKYGRDVPDYSVIMP